MHIVCINNTAMFYPEMEGVYDYSQIPKENFLNMVFCLQYKKSKK